MGGISRRKFLKISGAALAGNRLMAYVPDSVFSPWLQQDVNLPNRSASSETLEEIASGNQDIRKNVDATNSKEAATANYFAVSANENPVYANLNLQVLRNLGYATFIEKDRVSGLYRTIVSTTLKKGQLQKKLAELGRFDAQGIWELHFDEKKPAVKTLEEISNTIESESNKYVNGLEKSQYIAQLTPLVSTAQRNQKSKKYSQLGPAEVLGLIYDAAHEFNVPLSEFTSIIYSESSFSNVKGDLRFRSNFSEGIGQMRKTTQQYVFALMNQAGVEDLPNKLPQSILPDPRLQARMSAFYFAHCIEKGKGDVKRGMARYNAGQDSNKPNLGYVNQVASRQNDVMAVWR